MRFNFRETTSTISPASTMSFGRWLENLARRWHGGCIIVSFVTNRENQMRALKLGAGGGLGRIELIEMRDLDAPRGGEIRVGLHGSSLNFHDYRVVSGGSPMTVGRIPMADGAGVVEAVGEGVSEFAVGDSVVSGFFPLWLDGPPVFGDFATVPGDGVDGYAREAVVRPASWFTRAPRGFSHSEAATLTTAGLTAWRALVADGRLKAGDVILVLGTGGVAVFAVQFAKAMGASVIATSSSEEKLERLRRLGADHAINYRSEPRWGEAVWRWTGGRGVDHVIELGGPDTLPQSIAAARVGGHISLIGTVTGLSGQVPTAALMVKQVRLQGLIVGSRRQQQDMVRAIDVLGLKPVIDRTFALEALGDAFRYQESRQHFGKICLAW
jgi:NADPH:quinone reductase-like Zn-dependent oxidoreductase